MWSLPVQVPVLLLQSVSSCGHCAWHCEWHLWSAHCHLLLLLLLLHGLQKSPSSIHLR